MAIGHGSDGLPVPYCDISLLPGAGALASSMTDMARFVRAQQHPESTSLGAAIRFAHHAHTSAAGLGWMVDPTRNLAWHTGGTGGFRSVIAHRGPAAGAVVLINGTPPDADELLSAAVNTAMP